MCDHQPALFDVLAQKSHINYGLPLTDSFIIHETLLECF